MTVICYSRKSGTIASDSRMTAVGDTFTVGKIFGMPDGSVVAYAGDCALGDELVAWVAEGMPPLPGVKPSKAAAKRKADEEEEDDDASNGDRADAILIKPDGSTYLLLMPGMRKYQVYDDYLTVGSGGMVAKGALMAGATMVQAVSYACQVDPHCAMPAVTYHVKTKKRTLKK